jgi:hypothetical protein
MNDPMDNIPKILGGLKGPSVFNNPAQAARLSPGLTFKDGVPESIKKEMNMSTPKIGPVKDTWAQRKA